MKAGYLGDHPQVLATFAERIMEQDSDTPPPNCGTCQYRTQVLEVGGGDVRQITPEQREKLSAEKGGSHPAFAKVPPPTCVLCKYRTAVIGFENEVGAVQESHHHHVEGQGANAPGSNVADCKLCDTFCTGMCHLHAADHHQHHHDHGHSHEHDHHHAAYPHAKHPHGPESARKSKS